jgi:hypothetical protein
MDSRFWRKFTDVFILTQTLSVIMMLEIIFWKIPYVSLFLIIFYFVVKMNKQIVASVGKSRSRAIHSM